MPQGKPAGVRCIQLGDDARCLIFGQPERPAVCAGLMPAADMCGPDQGHALHYLAQLEEQTCPAPQPTGPLLHTATAAPCSVTNTPAPAENRRSA